MQLTALNPKDVADLLARGQAVLFDIRDPDEFARRHVKGARLRPLAALGADPLPVPAGRMAVFTCRSGMRTAANCARLAAAVEGETFVLEGGVEAWAAAGLPLVEDHAAPLELMRQVQIAAGSLVLAGVALGLLVHPGFFGLSAFVGAGLTLAGITGFCGMARLLAVMPWNRPARA
ncbi:rhodanese family protein [Phenylobacterium sp.]|uniref:rhodanese family protein n=1 Tax=Phenylobacterium sp. TaxID=1871053 RepID=UPI0028A2952B|nr:rhodanese family protein [Phenylobacterium sp.]